MWAQEREPQLLDQEGGTTHQPRSSYWERSRRSTLEHTLADHAS